MRSAWRSTRATSRPARCGWTCASWCARSPCCSPATARAEGPLRAMNRIVVNGRFLAQSRTGVQRYGLETLRCLDALLTRHPQFLEGIRWQLALPHDVRDVPLLENFEIQALQ